MALLTDLLNLDLSGSTEKIIAEYIWYALITRFHRSSFFLGIFRYGLRPTAVSTSWRPGRRRRQRVRSSRGVRDH
jgi:hypothetical protein